jgi:1,2-phenylacetyl-CoA epoxidase PaaB subunit
MQTYSLFHVDPTGLTGLSEELRAADDRTALEMAQRRFRRGVVELWDGQRLVGRLGQDVDNRVG